MSANVSARITEVKIGGLDWSAYLEFGNCGYPDYEMGRGLLPCTGQLTLLVDPNAPNPPADPVVTRNFGYWRQGQTVSIRIANSTGTLSALPCSSQYLYLLRPPQPPQRGGIGEPYRLVLEIGCDLALRDRQEPNDLTAIPFTAGETLNRGLIVSRLLSRLGIPNSVTSLPYPLQFPPDKSGSSYLQLAGQLADSAGYYLRSVNGVVVAEEILLGAGLTPAARWQIGVGGDEKEFTAIGDLGKPLSDQITVSGVIVSTTPVDTSSTPNTYDPQGRLIRTATETEFSPASYLFPDNPEILGTFASKQAWNEYRYKDPEGYVNQQVYREFGIAKAIAPDLYPEDTSFGEVQTVITGWVKNSDNSWTKTERTFELRKKVFPASSGGSRLALSKTNTSTSDTAPPNPNQRGTGQTSENQIAAQVFISGGFLPSDKPSQITLQHLAYEVGMARAQAESYGLKVLKIDVGRAFGWRTGVPISDFCLSSDCRPFALVGANDPLVTATYYWLRLDGLGWAFSPTEAYMLSNAITVGTAESVNDGSNPAPVPSTAKNTGSLIALTYGDGAYRPAQALVASSSGGAGIFYRLIALTTGDSGQVADEALELIALTIGDGAVDILELIALTLGGSN